MASSSILTVHSQSAIAPSCPPSAAKLWSGYSFGWTSAKGGHSQGQDLGRLGSCLRRFAPLPVTQCQGHPVNGTRCRSAPEKASSFWLTARQDGAAEVEMASQESQAYVSRCSVCVVQGAVVTLHSQSPAPPDCPPQWVSLWTGYSYLAVSWHQ